ncbi:hypothetical protein KAM479c_24140 (plasmid) [Aeromonas caviae]|nr:hypothetical protein KAM479c_24140 [Aeromonas caviae]
MGPVAAADKANAEATPIPIPANMDVFIASLLLQMPAGGLGAILGILALRLKQSAPPLRQRLAAQKTTATKERRRLATKVGRGEGRPLP